MALLPKKSLQSKKYTDQVIFPKGEIKVRGCCWPLYECWVRERLWEIGCGEVIIVRKSEQDEFVVGIYFVDVFCMGVKHCRLKYADNEYSYRAFFHSLNQDEPGEMLEKADPIYANTLIQESVSYARMLGLPPYRDFSKLKKLLTGIPVDATLSFTFGVDGEPIYVPGPGDSVTRIKRILSRHKNQKIFMNKTVKAI